MIAALDTSALRPLEPTGPGIAVAFDTSALRPLEGTDGTRLREQRLPSADDFLDAPDGPVDWMAGGRLLADEDVFGPVRQDRSLAKPLEAPAPRDLLAEHQAAGNLDSEGRVTLQAEIAADREIRSWLERNVSHPLQRGWNNLQQGIAANHLDKARSELEALDAIERGEKPKSGDGHAMVLALAHGKDPGFVARRRAELQRQIGQFSADVVQQGAEAAAVPQSPVVRRVNEAAASGDGWRQAWDAFTGDPSTYIANMGLESGPQSAVSMIVGLAAARSGGRAGATGRLAAGAGAGSGMVEYASSLVEGMQHFGVNIHDPAAIQAAAADAELWAKVQDFAEKRAAVVGTFDAATMGIAGMNLVPQAVKGTVAREVLNVPLQAPIQGAGGALGEVGASLATGQDITPGAVMGEFFGEMATAPVDIATAAIGKNQAEDANQPVAPAEPPPVGQEVAPAPSPAPAPGFVPTNAWQELPADSNISSDLDIRVDVSSGQRFARVRPSGIGADSDRGASTVQLEAAMKDPRSLADIQAEEEARALTAFGLEKGFQGVMTAGPVVDEPVTVQDAWMENGGRAWLRVRSEANGASYVVAPGEAQFARAPVDATQQDGYGAPGRATSTESGRLRAGSEASTAPPTPGATENLGAATSFVKPDFAEHDSQSFVEDLRQRLDARGLKHVRLVTPEQIAGGQADGYYMRRVIAVALDTENKPRALDHEVVHALRQLDLFRPGEWAALEKMARAKWMDQYGIRDRYAGLDMTEESFVEDAVAEAFADWAAGSYQPGGLVLRAFNMARKLLNIVAESFGAKGFHSVENVFSDAVAGRIGQRDSGDADADSDTGSTEALADQAASFLRRQPPNTTPPAPPASPVSGESQDLTGDAGLFARWMVHPRTIAALHRSFVPVYRTAVKQFETRDEIAAELSRMLEPYMNLSAEAKRKVNAALELGRLQQMVFNSSRLTAIKNDGYPQARLSKPGETIRLTPEEAAAYKAVRTAMNRALDLFKQQVIQEWGLDPAQVPTAKEIDQLILRATTPEEQTRLKKLAEIVREIEQAKRQGYVPFQRWGQVGVIVRKDGAPDPKTGQIQQETVYFETVEVDGPVQKTKRWVDRRLGKPTSLGTIPEVKAVLDRVKAEYGNKAGHEIKVFQVAPNAPMAGQVQMADLDMLAQVAQLDPQVWDAVRDGLQKAIQQRGMRAHFFGARNIPGYSADFERAIADYVVGVAGYLARRQFSDTWQRAIDAIPRTMPKLKEYAQRYHAYVQNPAEEFQMLRQAGFLYYLAGSVATAMVNMTQVPIITAPYLTQFHGKAGVVRELARAYRDAARMLTLEGAGAFRRLDTAAPHLFDPGKAPSDVRPALQKAWDEGFFVPLNTYEMMGAAYHRSAAIRGLTNRTRNAIDRVAIMFTVAERMNRLVTYIAAYRLAQKSPVAQAIKRVLKNNALARSDELLRQFTPEKFAGWVIDETHYRMGKVNRPTVMRGAGAALLQFKGFTMQTLELLFRLAKQNGREGRLAFVLVMACLFGTAGLWGIPFSQDLTDLIEELWKKFGGVDLDLQTEFRELIVEISGSPKLAELFARGGGRLVGVDLTRIGMGKIIPHDLEEVGGIPFSLTLGRVGQAIEYGKRGQGLMAFGEMLPQFLKNPIHAYAWGSDGIRSQATGKVVIPGEDITVAQQMLKGIGFTPGRISNARESEFAQNRANRAAGDVRNEFYGKLARILAGMYRAEQSGDGKEVARLEAKLREGMEEVARFNDGRPLHEQVKIDPRTLRQRAREELLGASVRDAKAPKQARARRQQIDEVYGTAPTD